MPQISEKFKSYVISTCTIHALIFCQCKSVGTRLSEKHAYMSMHVFMYVYVHKHVHVYVGRKLCVGLRSTPINDRWALARECL